MSDENDSDNLSSNENDGNGIASDSEEQQRSEIREKLGTMSFEELLKMKENMGSKLYNKMLSGNQNTKRLVKVKRANKNRPQEISSKIRPKVLQRTLIVPKTKKKTVIHRDPRFDSLCGTFDKDKFRTDYKFVYDLQEKEREVLEKEEKLEQDIEQKKKLKSAIQRLKNKSVEKKKINEKIEKKMKNKMEIKDKLKRGEKPVMKKQSEENVESLISQYETLKKSNKLGKYLIKKSKKLNAKEAKRHNEPIV